MLKTALLGILTIIIAMAMNQGKAEFATFVSDVELSDAKVPVMTNVDATSTVSADDFRAKMPKQIYSSVYWTQSVQKMVEEGVTTFVEIGPGKVLSGLVKKIAPEATVLNISDKASLDATVAALKEQMAAV